MTQQPHILIIHIVPAGFSSFGGFSREMMMLQIVYPKIKLKVNESSGQFSEKGAQILPVGGRFDLE
ncbi:hypothetical protein D8911_06345 [Levilactobacillus brevis]|nr:hypothetical protein D8911_06345 [Levilactobacillus brevis]